MNCNIDTNYPGGNIHVISINDDRVHVEQELRDTEPCGFIGISVFRCKAKRKSRLPSKMERWWGRLGLPSAKMVYIGIMTRKRRF